jgi:hypothetical protein
MLAQDIPLLLVKNRVFNLLLLVWEKVPVWFIPCSLLLPKGWVSNLSLVPPFSSSLTQNLSAVIFELVLRACIWTQNFMAVLRCRSLWAPPLATGLVHRHPRPCLPSFWVERFMLLSIVTAALIEICHSSGYVTEGAVAFDHQRRSDVLSGVVDAFRVVSKGRWILVVRRAYPAQLFLTLPHLFQLPFQFNFGHLFI